MLLLSLVLEWVYALNVTTCKIIVIIICLRVGVHAECDRSQHSCCHHVLFYSEYIIMLNVPGHVIHGVIIIPLFFFPILTYCLQERKSHARHLLSTRVKQPL